MNESQRLEDKNYEAALKVIEQVKGFCDDTKGFAKDIVDVIFGRRPAEVTLRVGDVVECVAKMSGAEKAHGRRGIIIAKEEDATSSFKGDWVVEFFDSIDGSHGCCDQVPSGKAFWMRADTLKLVTRSLLVFEKKVKEVKFQAGDIIEVTSPQDGRQVQGLRGIIVGKYLDRLWVVEFFEKFVGGHNCLGKTIDRLWTVEFFEKFVGGHNCLGKTNEGYGYFVDTDSMRCILRPNLSVKENVK